MTLALGFDCTDGLVLAADSEMITETSRFDGDKIWYFKTRGASGRGTKIGMVGAGNTRFLVDARHTVERGVEKQDPQMLDDRETVIRGVMHDIHLNHTYPIGSPYERGDYDIWPTIGAVTETGRWLMCSDKIAVTTVEKCNVIGGGVDLRRVDLRVCD